MYGYILGYAIIRTTVCTMLFLQERWEVACCLGYLELIIRPSIRSLGRHYCRLAKSFISSLLDYCSLDWPAYRLAVEE
jgi:hypothetical protein